MSNTLPTVINHGKQLLAERRAAKLLTHPKAHTGLKALFLICGTVAAISLSILINSWLAEGCPLGSGIITTHGKVCAIK